jgi:hypothetical protein
VPRRGTPRTSRRRKQSVAFGDENHWFIMQKGAVWRVPIGNDYRRHYDAHTPHRVLQLEPPDGRGGLTHEYAAA